MNCYIFATLFIIIVMICVYHRLQTMDAHGPLVKINSILYTIPLAKWIVSAWLSWLVPSPPIRAKCALVSSKKRAVSVFVESGDLVLWINTVLTVVFFRLESTLQRDQRSAVAVYIFYHVSRCNTYALCMYVLGVNPDAGAYIYTFMNRQNRIFPFQQ